MGFNLDKFLTAYKEDIFPWWDEESKGDYDQRYAEGYAQAVEDVIHDIEKGWYDD